MVKSKKEASYKHEIIHITESLLNKYNIEDPELTGDQLYHVGVLVFEHVNGLSSLDEIKSKIENKDIKKEWIEFACHIWEISKKKDAFEKEKIRLKKKESRYIQEIKDLEESVHEKEDIIKEYDDDYWDLHVSVNTSSFWQRLKYLFTGSLNDLK